MRKRVLIVEDNGDVSLMLGMLVELLGHDLLGTVTDGDAVVDAVVNLRPDVVLLDIGLPHQTGWAVVRQIRALLGERPLICVVSGFGQGRDVMASLAAGCDLHLTKPVPVDALAHALGRAYDVAWEGC